MKPIPADPMRQHARFITAFCDDLLDLCVKGGTGTPRTDAVVEISRQLSSTGEEAGAQQVPATDRQ